MVWYLLRDGFFLLVGGFLLFSFFFGKAAKGPRFDRPWEATFRQTLALALSAGLLGLFLNQLRSDSMPLLGDWSPEARVTLKFGKNILIPFDEAKDRFFKGSAVFIDARAPEHFQEGHIQGAFNLPLAEFDHMIDKVLPHLPEEALIVTYCDGEDCDLSAKIALKLKEIGYDNVRVLFNGWSLWKSHPLPFKGAEPQEEGG
jgi:rhodanese-related sulfurtransferase